MKNVMREKIKKMNRHFLPLFGYDVTMEGMQYERKGETCENTVA